MKQWIWAVILVGLLAACGAADIAGDPADVVAQYVQAKVEGDADVIGQLLCSEMESNLQAEAASFSAVDNPRIEGLQCTADGNVVSCEGEILADYGTGDEVFPLGAYRVVQEDGEWKWCGETAG